MCGIIGIYNFLINNNIVNQTYENLKNLQHRGRDSYGYVFYNNKFKTYKQLGKIEEPKEIDEKYKFSLGHTKYTTSKFKKKNINSNEDLLKITQPFRGINKRLGEFYLVHNGNINNLESVKELFDMEKEEIYNDSHLLLKIIEKLELQRWEDIFNQLILSIEGSFSILVLTKDSLFAFKDIKGYRPLCIGFNENGYCFASESVGLGEYNYLREIERGEIVIINNNKMNIYEVFVDLGKIKKKSCLFESIYFLSKDSIFSNKKVEDIRYQYGIELGKKESVINSKKDCLVIGAPSTGIPIGKGFSDYLGIRYEQILVKNKNAGRSFILKNTEERLSECRKKFIINQGELMTDKIIYFVDDSLVRGNTLKVIIEILKLYRPKEIHLRISSPKILNICNYGIDIPSKEELIMNSNTEEEYIKNIGADSLVFLELEKLYSVLGDDSYCINCFTSSLEW